jgi:hypothetical protein
MDKHCTEPEDCTSTVAGPRTELGLGFWSRAGSCQLAVSELDGGGLPYTLLTPLKPGTSRTQDLAVKFGSGRAGNSSRAERIE